MHETHGCAPARMTWGAIRGCGPWEVRTKSPSCDAIVTCVPGSLCVLPIFVPVYHEPVRVPRGFRKVSPFECSVGPCRRRTGFGTTYGQSCKPVWGEYRACRTYKYGRLLNHARPSTDPKSSEAHFWKLYMLIFQPRTRQRSTGHPPSLISVFAMRLIGKQGHKASSYEQRSNQTELGAHVISVLSCTGWHITAVTYFHNNNLLACVETNRIKTSCFEAMSNEKWKQKCYIYKTMCIVTDWAVSGIYKELKAYLRYHVQ